MPHPTVINGSEVFNSEDCLALMIDGNDVLYLSLRYEDGKPLITPEQHQAVIDTITKALGTED